MRLVTAFLIMGVLSFLSTALLFHPDGWSEVAHITATTLGIGVSVAAGCWYYNREVRPEPTPEPRKVGRASLHL